MHNQTITAAQQLAGRLKELRNQKGISQDALSRASGLTRVTLAAMERGSSNPRLSNLEQLAKALRVDVLDLFLARPTNQQVPGPDECSLRIAKSINRFRVSAALSQEALSTSSGHFRTYVGNLERQRVKPHVNDLEQIARVLGIDVASILQPLSNVESQGEMKKMVSGRKRASSDDTE
jgi:transcriptional regulator with XRE-family HTH domain